MPFAPSAVRSPSVSAGPSLSAGPPLLTEPSLSAGPSPGTSTELERIRVKLGLPVPMLLRLIGARQGRRSLLTVPDARVDEVFLERARALEQRYDAWKAELIAQVEHQGSMSVPAFARLLDMSEFALWREARCAHLPVAEGRGYLNRREHRVTPEAVRAMFAHSETILGVPAEQRSLRRGSFASAFERLVAHERAGIPLHPELHEP